MKHLTKASLFGGALFCAGLMGPHALAGDCITQPNTGFDNRFTDAVPGQYWNQQFADNFFAPPGGFLLGEVRWWGASENFDFPGLTNFGSFTVEILDDSLSVIYSETFPTASVDLGTTGNVSGNGGEEHAFNASLSQLLWLEGGREYWVSIGTTNIDSESDGFDWSTSDVGDGVIADDQDLSDGVQLVPVILPGLDDMAFEVCPAPSSMIAVQPLGDVIDAPGSAELRVQLLIRNGSHAFQWMRDGVPLADGGSIFGATTDTLEISPFTPADVGRYSVLVSDGVVEERSLSAIVALRSCLAGDNNGDGVSDFSDLNAVLAQFGASCDGGGIPIN